MTLPGLPKADGYVYFAQDERGKPFVYLGAPRKAYSVDLVGREAKEVATFPLEIVAVGGVAVRDGGKGWALFSFINGKPRLFRNSEEEELAAPPWTVEGLAFAKGRVVACLGTMSLSKGEPQDASKPRHTLDADVAPLLATLSDKDSSDALVKRPTPAPRGGHSAPADYVPGIQARDRTCLLATEPNGDLWYASRLRFDVRHYGADGVLKQRIRVGDQKIETVAMAGEIKEQRAAFIREKLGRDARPGDLQIAVLPLGGLSIGPDGLAYILSRSDGYLTLYRMNDATGALERVRLLGVPDSVFGILATAEGLLLAPKSGTAGITWIPWKAVEVAKWAPIDEVNLNLDD